MHIFLSTTKFHRGINKTKSLQLAKQAALAIVSAAIKSPESQKIIALSNYIEQSANDIACGYENADIAAGIEIGMRRAAEMLRDKVTKTVVTDIENER